MCEQKFLKNWPNSTHPHKELARHCELVRKHVFHLCDYPVHVIHIVAMRMFPVVVDMQCDHGPALHSGLSCDEKTLNPVTR
jgi:hypothetical protein